MRVREPVARPLDIVAVELSLSASQAFLAGVLLYLAVGFWEDRGIGLGSVAAVVILLGLAVGAAWLDDRVDGRIILQGTPIVRERLGAGQSKIGMASCWDRV